MSFCTTSSSKRRPIRRFTANVVFCGLVTACRLADWPTRTSSSLVKATMDGVVRSPSLFSITRGLPPSMIATQELVVPRSMPMTFAMYVRLRSSITRWRYWLGRDTTIQAGYPSVRLVGGARHDYSRRPQQPAVERVALLDDREDRAWRGLGGFLGRHGLVQLRVEGLPLRIDDGDPRPLESLEQQPPSRLHAFDEPGGIGPRAPRGAELQAVRHLEQVGGQTLRAKPPRRLDVALGALAGVVRLRHGTQQRVTVRLGLRERRPQSLELGGEVVLRHGVLRATHRILITVCIHSWIASKQ